MASPYKGGIFESSYVVDPTNSCRSDGTRGSVPFATPSHAPSSQLQSQWHLLPWEIVESILYYACKDDPPTSAKFCRISYQIYKLVLPCLLSVVICTNPRIEGHADQFIQMLSTPMPRTIDPPRGHNLQSLCLIAPSSYRNSEGYTKITRSLLSILPNLRNIALGMAYSQLFFSPWPFSPEIHNEHIDLTLFPDTHWSRKLPLHKLISSMRLQKPVFRHGMRKTIHALHFVRKCRNLLHCAWEAAASFINLTHLALTYDDEIIYTGERQGKEYIPPQLTMLVVVVKSNILMHGGPGNGEQAVHMLCERDNRVFISWSVDRYEDKWVSFAQGGESIWDRARRETAEWKVAYS
jgi:hypothetical protein